MKRIKWSEFYRVMGEYIQALFKIIQAVRTDALNADKEFMKNHQKRKYTILKERVSKDRLFEIEGTLLHRSPTMDELQLVTLYEGIGIKNLNGVLELIKEYESFAASIAGAEKIPLRPAALEVVIKDRNDVMFYP
jgi:hypothetical protein